MLLLTLTARTGAAHSGSALDDGGGLYIGQVSQPHFIHISPSFPAMNSLKAARCAVALSSLYVFAARAQPPGAITPLAQPCGPTAGVVCINKYASVMPYHFYRQASINGSYEDTYQSTVVDNDSSWSLVGTADFLVFDQQRGLPVLGSAPSYEYMFYVNDGLYPRYWRKHFAHNLCSSCA